MLTFDFSQSSFAEKYSHYSDNKGTGKIPCSLFSTEKSSLDLISFDRTSWALSYANTAVRAELRINMRQIIRNRNGTRRTSLFTLFAANTAIPADFSGLRPFVMAGAADIDFASCRNNIDQMIGTFPRAHTTAYALTLIYYGNAHPQYESHHIYKPVRSRQTPGRHENNSPAPDKKSYRPHRSLRLHSP